MTADALKPLLHISTATIATLLFKRGIRNVAMRGPMPLEPGQGRIAGPAFTVRFVPGREDLATPESLSSETSMQTAIDAMPEGVVAVVDGRGVADAGVVGDIFCERMLRRGVAGLITDSGARDVEGILSGGLPVWCAAATPPLSIAGLTSVGRQEVIGCGGVAVVPDDVIVADKDGAVVIPATFVDEVIKDGIALEQFEAWVLDKVRGGAALTGLYPATEESKAQYEAEKSG